MHLNYNQIQSFLTAKTGTNPDGRVSSVQLYAAYAAWVPQVSKAGKPHRPKTFTAAVRDAYEPWPQVRYGVHLIGDKVTRGFRGLRLTTPDDNMHDDIPEGKLRLVAQLLDAAVVRNASDSLADQFATDMDAAKDLLITATHSPWANAVALELVDAYEEWFPELGTPVALLKG